MRSNDTICALCTAPGTAALAVIRISGPLASKTVRHFVGLPETIESHRAYVRLFKEDKRSIDEVVLTYFAKGRSFTGEETFEISCHGGPLIYSRILHLLLKAGLRIAEPGEFSLRAFYNGKKDLTQAEALLQLIESRSERARRSAFSQMQGQLSVKLSQLEGKWLHLLSHLEADIDFSLENLQTLSAEDTEKALKELGAMVQALLDRYRTFESLERGLTVTFFGPPNSGKSTLFNRLLGESKAIVTEEAGTTRDIVEGEMRDLEHQVHLSLRDTAGLRDTASLAEQTGQLKSKELFFNCDVPVMVLSAPEFISTATNKSPLKEVLDSLDSTYLFDSENEMLSGKSLKDKSESLSYKKRRLEKGETFKESSLRDQRDKSPALSLFLKKGLIVVTKKDLLPQLKKEELLKNLFLEFSSEKVFYFSNKKEEDGTDEFNRFKDILLSLERQQQENESAEESFFVTNLRHLQGLRKMKASLREALELQQGQGERDLMALSLRRGLLSLYEITGKQLDDKVLDTVFKKFCIGK